MIIVLPKSPVSVSYKNLGSFDKNDQQRRIHHQIMKKCTLYQIILVFTIFAVIFISTRVLVPYLLKSVLVISMDVAHLSDYISLAEIAVVGFIVIRILAQLAYRVLIDVSKRQASTSRSIITIAGYLTVVSIIVATLAKDPTVTVAISTITGIVLGISAQSLIGNAIAGMVLAISRPFRIGDTIKAFDNTGIVEDIGLLYTRIMTADGNILIAPNTTLRSSAVLKLKVERKDTKTDTTEAA